jgi:hypothetical protein
MTKIEYLDHPPAGWFVPDVVPRNDEGREWSALMLDVDPDDPKTSAFDRLSAHECWVRIPGKHSERDAAWDALEDMMATRL